MGKAGIFAGEVTQQAPADGAVTTKWKGYQWMEYGNVYVAPLNCSFVWDIATTTPDLHVAGEALGAWNGGLMIGTGTLADGKPTGENAPQLDGWYDVFTTSPTVIGVYDCQNYIYSGPEVQNKIQVATVPGFTAGWTESGTGSLSTDQTGITGIANTATLLTDSGTGDYYKVRERTSVNKTTLNGGTVTAKLIVKKDATATVYGMLAIGTYIGSNYVNVVFHPASGDVSVFASAGADPAAEIIDRGEWWEVYAQMTKSTGGTLTECAIDIYPAFSADGSTDDVSLTGSITVGHVDVYDDTESPFVGSIGLVRGGINIYKLTSTGVYALGPNSNYISLANHSNTGGYYIEWRPMYDHAEISGDVSILSLNGSAGLLFYDYSEQAITCTDGTNTVSTPITVTKNTKYRLGVVFGDSKMQVGVDGQWSVEGTYAGAFPTSTQFDILPTPEAVNYWRELRGYQIAYADAYDEIIHLMLASSIPIEAPTYVGPDISDFSATNGNAITPIDASTRFTGDVLVFSLGGSWPTGLSIDQFTGVISGTPTDDTGDYSGLYVTATNSEGSANSATFTISVIYDPLWMTFDGSTGYYSKSSVNLTQNQVTGVVRFKRSSFSGATEMLLYASTAGAYNRCAILIGSSDHATTDYRNKVIVLTQNGSGTSLCRLISSTDLADGSEHTVFYSFDAATGSAILYVDGVDEDDTGNASRIAPITGTIGGDSTRSIGIGATSYGTTFFGGQLSYVGFKQAYLTNPTDFFNPTNGLQELDTSTWTEWGGQPGLFTPDGKSDTNNLGSYGAFTKNGTITGPA